MNETTDPTQEPMEDLQDELRWDELFERIQPQLIAAARRAGSKSLPAWPRRWITANVEISHMSDFDDLRQMRETKERAEDLARQKAHEEERRKAEAAQRLQARKTASADNLNGMVVEILEELRDAVYPDLQVRRLGPDSWGVVRETFGDGEFSRSSFVVVELEFDKQGEAKRLVSHKGSSRYGERLISSDLTRWDLVRALKKLHPPESSR